MYADVCVQCRSAEALSTLQDLGYAVACWTTEATGSVPSKPPKQAGVACAASRSSHSQSSGGAGAPSSSSFTRPVHECTRLTLGLEEESHAFALAGAREALRAYDLVAVSPATEAILERVLQSPAVGCVDLIALPSGQKLPFHLRPALARRVLDAGIQFELCYAGALREGSARRHFVSNLQALVEALPKGVRRSGTGLVLSSGADEARLLRTPHDVVALATAFGCRADAVRLALSGNPFKTLERAARRQTPPPGAPPAADGLFSLGPLPSTAAAVRPPASAGGRPDTSTPSATRDAKKPRR